MTCSSILSRQRWRGFHASSSSSQLLLLLLLLFLMLLLLLLTVLLLPDSQCLTPHNALSGTRLVASSNTASSKLKYSRMVLLFVASSSCVQSMREPPGPRQRHSQTSAAYRH